MQDARLLEHPNEHHPRTENRRGETVKLIQKTALCTRIIRYIDARSHSICEGLIKLRVGNSTQILAPLATFTLFVIIASTTGETLNTSSAYTALSLITLLVCIHQVF